MKNKTRNMKVCYSSQSRQGKYYGASRYVTVPTIKLSGKWLESLGFDIDTPIAVECSEGRLVITKREI